MCYGPLHIYLLKYTEQDLGFAEFTNDVEEVLKEHKTQQKVCLQDADVHEIDLSSGPRTEDVSHGRQWTERRGIAKAAGDALCC